MKFLSFYEWLKLKESSPFTRSRDAFGWGQGVDIPKASLNSHSTAPPWIIEKLSKKKKKKKKKRRAH